LIAAEVVEAVLEIDGESSSKHIFAEGDRKDMA